MIDPMRWLAAASMFVILSLFLVSAAMLVYVIVVWPCALLVALPAAIGVAWLLKRGTI